VDYPVQQALLVLRVLQVYQVHRVPLGWVLQVKQDYQVQQVHKALPVVLVQVDYQDQLGPTALLVLQELELAVLLGQKAQWVLPVFLDQLVYRVLLVIRVLQAFREHRDR